MRKWLLAVAAIATLAVAWATRFQIYEWWRWLSPSIQGGIMGAAGTVIGAAGGVFAVVWQIGRQAEHALAQIRLNETTKLKIDIYKSVIKTCEAAEDAITDAQTHLRLLTTEWSSVIGQSYAPRSINQWAQTFQTINENTSKLGAACIAIVSTVEQWNVLDLRLDVFQSAFGCALFDIRGAMTRDLLGTMLEQREVRGDSTLIIERSAFEKLSKLASVAVDTLQTAMGYVTDFRIAMQRLLIGDLFNQDIPARAPITGTAITLEHAQELKRYFADETPWGRSNAEALEEATQWVKQGAAE